jgi:hypothetical protein
MGAEIYVRSFGKLKRLLFAVLLMLRTNTKDIFPISLLPHGSFAIVNKRLSSLFWKEIIKSYFMESCLSFTCLAHDEKDMISPSILKKSMQKES